MWKERLIQKLTSRKFLAFLVFMILDVVVGAVFGNWPETLKLALYAVAVYVPVEGFVDFIRIYTGE